MNDDDERRGALCGDCAPYLLGALSQERAEAFEAHLTGCPDCQDDCDDIGPSASALGGLSAADIRELLDETDRLDPPTAPRLLSNRLRPRGPGSRLPATVAGSGPSGRDRRPLGSSGPGRASAADEKPPLPCLAVIRCLRRWGGQLRLRVLAMLNMLVVFRARVAVAPGYDGE
ncbi:zf-HC2 domain-containing protein [Micromonospora arborensis]|uniref:zf-HC2 domain-containing protein n=1 Tax=Micromonospora arborensis TaxID=2116518 RepID=UPI003444B743